VKGLAGSAFTTWLTLIAVQALAQRESAGRVSQLFADVDRLLERALDPTVPAIPDRRAANGASTPTAPKARNPVATKTTTTKTTTTPRLRVPGAPQPV